MFASYNTQLYYCAIPKLCLVLLLQVFLYSLVGLATIIPKNGLKIYPDNLQKGSKNLSFISKNLVNTSKNLQISLKFSFEIRVFLQKCGFPVVELYGYSGRPSSPTNIDESLQTNLLFID